MTDNDLLQNLATDLREIRASMNEFHEDVRWKLGDNAAKIETLSNAIQKHVECCPYAKTVKDLSLEVWGQPGIEGTGLKDKVNGAVKLIGLFKWFAGIGGIGGIIAFVKSFGLGMSQK